MRSFKFKDLMINIGSGRGLLPLLCEEPSFCLPRTFHVTCGPSITRQAKADILHCQPISVPVACEFLTRTIPIGTFTPIVDPPEDLGAVSEQLAAVKGQLQEALRQVEARQIALDASLQPQTVAEVEELQAKLNEAGAELERRKRALQGNAK